MKAINVMMTSLATLLMAGCSQNEVTEVSPDAHPAIGFSVYTGVPTRGTDMTTSSMQDPYDKDHYGGFGIMGYYTGSTPWGETDKNTISPSFMHNQKVTWDGTLNEGNGGWTYSPVKYWPNNPNDMISFFAYAPYDEDWKNGAKTGIVTSSESDTGIPAITFSLQPEDKLKKMVDLVVADVLDQKYSSNSENSGKISFAFAHTLSRISFKAQLGDGEFKDMDGTNSFIYVTRMWIIGKNHGTTEADGNMAWVTPKFESNKDSKFYTKAAWSELHWNYEKATIADKDFSLIDMLDKDVNGISEVAPDGTEKKVYGVKLTSESQTTPVSLFPKNQYLYLIPVGDSTVDVPGEGQGGCAAGDIQIGFHYDIVSKSTTGTDKFIVSHAEAKISIPVNHMKRAKSYVYTLKINLHKIEIDKATVTPWEDTSEDVTIQ